VVGLKSASGLQKAFLPPDRSDAAEDSPWEAPDSGLGPLTPVSILLFCFTVFIKANIQNKTYPPWESTENLVSHVLTQP
jgi:hypothetical protein